MKEKSIQANETPIKTRSKVRFKTTKKKNK